MNPETVLFDSEKTFDENFDSGPFNPPEKRYENEGQPKYSFLGFDVHSPFGIPAGPLPTSRHTTAAFELGFDVVCYKTQRSVAFEVNKFPNVLAVDATGDLQPNSELVAADGFPDDTANLSITNSFGNPSRGPEYWQKDIEAANAGASEGQLMILSVVGTIQEGFTAKQYYDDFAHSAKLGAEGGAKVIELNLSCPNVASEGVLCYSVDAVHEICELTRQSIGDIPIVAKVGYYTKDQQTILEAIVEKIDPYVNAISTINTIPSKIVDANGNQALPGEGRLTSGVCGASVRWAGLEMVQRLQELRSKNRYNYEIVGVGGVQSVEDYKALIGAGANCVQSATGAMWNPLLAQQIKEAL